MKTGLLWYDASNKPLAVKIAEAAVRFQSRTGLLANCAHIPPSDVPETDKQQPPTAAGCTLIPDGSSCHTISGLAGRRTPHNPNVISIP